MDSALSHLAKKTITFEDPTLEHPILLAHKTRLRGRFAHAGHATYSACGIPIRPALELGPTAQGIGGGRPTVDEARASLVHTRQLGQPLVFLKSFRLSTLAPRGAQPWQPA